MADQYNDNDPAASAVADDGNAAAGDETAADQAEGATGAPVETQQDAALETLEREKNELKDRLLRTAAEFDNFRKRVERERRELLEFAASDVLTEMLPIVDNFERALQTPAPAEADAFRKGMLDLLRKRGVTPIDAVGADFDPRFHQAVMQDASDEHREGEVMQELQRGYMLGERLLRPSMVKVAKRS